MNAAAPAVPAAPGAALTRVPDYRALLTSAWAAHLAPRAADAPTVVSTFAGCGGSSLGYSMAGFRELLAVEWEQHAVNSFKANFPHVPVYHGDIAKLSVDDCLARIGLRPGELSVFDGSPPCQGFSTVGQRETGDSRNGLFKEFARLLAGLRPRAFVMENVTGMVKGDAKVVFADALRTLKGCGYKVRARQLSAMYFGVPQARDRLIFVGIREDLGIDASHPLGWSQPITLREAIGDLPNDGPVATGTKGDALRRMPPGGCNGGETYMKHSFALTRGDFARVAPTLLKSSGVFSHPAGDRYLSIAGAKRVGSFPDPFLLAGSYAKQWARIGNSVPPLLMRSIALHLRASGAL